MALSTEQLRENARLLEEATERAFIQSTQETESLIAFYKIFHWLSTFNQDNELQPSSSGSIIMSDDILRSVGYGFTAPSHARPQTFIIHLQEVEYDMFKLLTLQASWLEEDGISIMFRALKFADYLIPPIRLFFKIRSPVIREELKKKCEFVTIALIEKSEIDPNKFSIGEVLNPVAPLLLEAPSNKAKSKKYMKAFS